MRLGQVFASLEAEIVAAGEEAESLAFVYRSLKQLSLTDFVFKLQTEAVQEDIDLLEGLTQQLKAHLPAQYILGWADFYGLRLSVDERVLIPRPETEELVDLILAENPDSGQQVLDLATGSGAIALALARHRPSWQLTASDISQEALDLAQTNASTLNLQQAIDFVQSDVFENLTGKFDLLVSNPPYIAFEDQDEVGSNVLHAEPHLALFAENQGLALYQAIAQGVSRHLKKDGKIYLEIGYKQGPAVQALFQEAFPHKRVRVLKDQFNQDRMVVVDNG
ncbi:peptide chain release factor N(5)-glutamine methyltransferase [Streptococcus oricebi]|uniref:Release factor glutamine methyltransferase n=1 Tax=Streptococcus oricebi TaxID=1547447 RepID=A0ABS5B0I7_9STRE|nr:peptide chain release factor N(5)-glutamine methyltransferase [Streptococcus oricebi]MBP2622343.1 peptide chain release factor N(5)-glutamine methyltransferase [Streptococcus oricebi]